jgi:dihydrofolate reductase
MKINFIVSTSKLRNILITPWYIEPYKMILLRATQHKDNALIMTENNHEFLDCDYYHSTYDILLHPNCLPYKLISNQSNYSLYKYKDYTQHNNMFDALKDCLEKDKKEVWIFGNEELYRDCLITYYPFMDKIIILEMNNYKIENLNVFPEIDKNEWNMIDSFILHGTDDKVITYKNSERR